MYYSRMGAGAPGNFEGMQRATTGADMVGLNFNTGGQYKGSNPQLAFDQFGSIEDVLQGRRNYGDIAGDPSGRPQPQRNTMVPGMNVVTDPLQDAIKMGLDNVGSLYRRTDARYFGGRLPGGAQQPTFVDTLPQTPSGPGFYNMPGYGNQIPMGDGFIGPRSNEQLRREALEQIRLEDEENKRYSSDPTLAQGLPYQNGVPLQGPSQGPATMIKNYGGGMGYGPVGPAGGGLPPDPFPARASGFNNKFVS